MRKSEKVPWIIAGFCIGVTTCAAALLGAVFLPLSIGSLISGTLEDQSENARQIAAEFVADFPPPVLPFAEEADFGLAVQALDGSALDLGALRGKVIFLHFWSASSPVCVEEMRRIEKLYRKAASSKVAFVCVALDDAATVRRFMQTHGHQMPVYTLNGEIPTVFTHRALPTTFLIAPNGAIAFSHTGTAEWDGAFCFRFIRALAGLGDQNERLPAFSDPRFPLL